MDLKSKFKSRKFITSCVGMLLGAIMIFCGIYLRDYNMIMLGVGLFAASMCGYNVMEGVVDAFRVKANGTLTTISAATTAKEVVADALSNAIKANTVQPTPSVEAKNE